MSVLVSAHRGGFEGDISIENSPLAIAKSINLGVDFVEIDVQRTLDGQFVIAHDDVVHAPRPVQISQMELKELEKSGLTLLTLREALALMKGKVGAHIDVKFLSPSTEEDWEESLVRETVEILGTSGFILTSLEDSSVLRMRHLLKSLGEPDVLVGLSLGRNVESLSLRERVKIRRSELRPARRIKDSDANLVVVHHKLARLTVLAWAAKRKLPALVWTVDEPEDLRTFLADKRVWMVTSNFPRTALEIRAQ